MNSWSSVSQQLFTINSVWSQALKWHTCQSQVFSWYLHKYCTETKTLSTAQSEQCWELIGVNRLHSNPEINIWWCTVCRCWWSLGAALVDDNKHLMITGITHPCHALECAGCSGMCWLQTVKFQTKVIITKLLWIWVTNTTDFLDLIWTFDLVQHGNGSIHSNVHIQ